MHCSAAKARLAEDERERVVISFVRFLYLLADTDTGVSSTVASVAQACTATVGVSARCETGLQTVTVPFGGIFCPPFTDGRALCGLGACSSSVRAFVEARGRSFSCTDSFPLMKVSG